MTSSFDQRTQAFENKFKADEDLRFRVNAKAVQLFGLWAAEKLGLKDKAAEHYAGKVVDADFDEPGIQDVLRKVRQDLGDKGIDMTLHHLENEFNVHLAAAKKAMMQG